MSSTPLRMSERCFQDLDGSREGRAGRVSSVGMGIWECLAGPFGWRGAFRQSQQKQASVALGRQGLV